MQRPLMSQTVTVVPGCHSVLRLWIWFIPEETTAAFHH